MVETYNNFVLPAVNSSAMILFAAKSNSLITDFSQLKYLDFKLYESVDELELIEGDYYCILTYWFGLNYVFNQTNTFNIVPVAVDAMSDLHVFVWDKKGTHLVFSNSTWENQTACQ